MTRTSPGPTPRCCAALTIRPNRGAGSSPGSVTATSTWCSRSRPRTRVHLVTEHGVVPEAPTRRDEQDRLEQPLRVPRPPNARHRPGRRRSVHRDELPEVPDDQIRAVLGEPGGGVVPVHADDEPQLARPTRSHSRDRIVEDNRVRSENPEDVAALRSASGTGSPAGSRRAPSTPVTRTEKRSSRPARSRSASEPSFAEITARCLPA